MKKILTLGVLALGLTALSGQQASAWHKFNFSVGLNLSWESGNNSLLWGLYNNGQLPGYASDSRHFYGWGPQWGYQMPMYYHYPVMQYAAQPAYSAPQPQQHYQTPEPPRAKEAAQSSSYGSNGYQAVGYTYPSNYSYYPTQGYYQASWGYYGHYQVPSYWYGY